MRILLNNFVVFVGRLSWRIKRLLVLCLRCRRLSRNCDKLMMDLSFLSMSWGIGLFIWRMRGINWILCWEDVMLLRRIWMGLWKRLMFIELKLGLILRRVCYLLRKNSLRSWVWLFSNYKCSGMSLVVVVEIWSGGSRFWKLICDRICRWDLISLIVWYLRIWLVENFLVGWRLFRRNWRRCRIFFVVLKIVCWRWSRSLRSWLVGLRR